VLASLVLHALILYFLPLLRELDKSRVELPPLLLNPLITVLRAFSRSLSDG
jgi:hypothetical protein